MNNCKLKVSVVLILMFFAFIAYGNSFLHPYYTVLTGTFSKSQLYKINLRADILSKCSSKLSDIRLSSEKGDSIPYVIVDDLKPSHGIPKDSYKLTFLTFQESEAEYIITASLPSNSEPIRIFNFETNSVDFNKTIKVFSGNDSKEWKFVSEGNIFDFSSKIKLRNTEIETPYINEKYIKFHITDKVFHEPKIENDSLRIEYMGANISLNQFQNKKLVLNGITSKTKNSIDKFEVLYDEIFINDFFHEISKENSTLIYFECLYPTEKIEFDIKDTFSFRKIFIYSGNTNDECRNNLKKNRYDFSSQIKSIPGNTDTSFNNSIEVSSLKNKHLIIEIRNDDNPPLNVNSIRIKWIRKYLIFASNNNFNELKLFFGNHDDLKKPNYDIAMLINQTNWYKYPYIEINPSNVKNTPSFKPKPSKLEKERLNKRISTLITFALVFLLTAWFVKLMKENK